MGIKGQVVIPKAIREGAGMRPGDQMAFERNGTEVTVRRTVNEPEARERGIKALRGAWADVSGVGTDDLLAERRREREREERKAQRWDVGRT